MTVADNSETELVVLRKTAQDMAQTRKERLNTAHLLAAIAFRISPAAELLRERRLDVDTLARVARASNESEKDPIGNAMRRASELARSSGTREPAAIHLLVALASNRKSGAFRALEQCGVDVARLRTAAIQIAGGMIEPRRSSSHELQSRGASAPNNAPAPSSARPPARPPAQGVIVPLLPPVAMSQSPAARRAGGPARVEAPAEQVTFELPRKAESPASPKHAEPATPPTRSRTAARRRSARGAPAAPATLDPSRFELEQHKFPVLSAIGVNLTLAAARQELEPVVARDVEIDQTLDVLARRRANNPCLVGPMGVGKSSVARGLAMRIAAARDVRTLDDRILVELPLARLLSNSMRGALPERFASICKEVRESKGRVVLLLDDVHQLLAGDAAMELGGDVRAALGTGDLPMIATATADEYKRVIESDPSLATCFSPIEIDEPTQDHAIEMLQAASPSLESHHSVSISRDAISSAVSWSVRYLPGRALPDKALSVLDLACARSRRRARTTLGAEAVAEVVAEMADMPVERLLETDRDRMLSLEKLLGQRVVGHDEALQRIALILRRNAAGLRGRRPIGSFLLLGPTGVGKTETAKAIAEALFHSADAMTRLDLSEFAEPHSLARLIGAPPGYVGHEHGGQLTEAIRRRPYQVVLLDEIEKANRDVLEAFLQVLDEGRMTDGRGRTVDMTNTVIVMTSNLGSGEAAEASRARSIGFSRKTSASDREIETVVVGAARGALPPELYNRIDEVIPFAPLSREHVREVASRLLAALSKQLESARKVRLVFDGEAIEALLDLGGFDPAFGARPMKRTIARLVEAPIAEIILREQIPEGGSLRLHRRADGSIGLEAIKARSAAHMHLS
ncbi:MAG: ATP-dependent Clp protease ATP-binding subunit [Deltaproteobacteria bacterium]|nr:ATP-dependent Clp protease ATP-binding subunit [Deltaproteobacteria bacterium]